VSAHGVKLGVKYDINAKILNKNFMNNIEKLRVAGAGHLDQIPQRETRNPKRKFIKSRTATITVSSIVNID